MGDGTGIEWTDATWNPTVGCTKVSPGCDHCYAETFVNRFAGSKGFPLPFDQMLLRDERFLNLPKTWKEPRRVFVNSLSDLFHKDVPDEFIGRVFQVMADTPRHTFQLLTKRHARMRSWVTKHYPTPLPNVWLGVSVEDEYWAETRIPHLLATPAAIRWISAEPLLGPVTFGPTLYGGPDGPGLDWIVVGGESGPGSRPMEPWWAVGIRDECAAAGVPFLFKQWGSHDENGYNVGKKQAGRHLEGALHNGYPQSRSTGAAHA